MPITSRRRLIVGFSLFALPALLPVPAAAQMAITALVGGTLVNPASAPVRDAVVIVRGQRIVCAGARAACAVPPGARPIDARGAFIIPGLVDAHVHYSQTG